MAKKELNINLLTARYFSVKYQFSIRGYLMLTNELKPLLRLFLIGLSVLHINQVIGETPKTYQEIENEKIEISMESIPHYVSELNPEIIKAKYFLSELHALDKGAGIWTNPTIQPGVIRNLNTREYNLSFGVSQKLLSSHKRKSQQSISSNKISLQDSALYLQIFRASEEARDLLIHLTSFHKKEKLLMEQLDNFEKLLALKTLFISQGEESEINAGYLEHRIFLKKQELENLKILNDTTRADLALIFGKSAPNNVALVFPDWKIPNTIPQVDLSKLEEHPEIKFRKSQIDLAHAQIRLEKNRKYTDPTLMAEVQSGIVEDIPIGFEQETSFRFGVSFQLPIWNDNSHNVKAKRIMAQQKEASLGFTKNELKTRAHSLRRNLETLLHNINNTRTIAISASEKRVESLNKFNKNGVASIDQVARAQTEHFEMELSLLSIEEQFLKLFNSYCSLFQINAIH